jgi:hypothetical protein
MTKGCHLCKIHVKSAWPYEYNEEYTRFTINKMLG